MKLLIGIFAVLGLFASGVIVEAQQKPSPVQIWCQNSTGTSAPCQGGNAIDYDSGGGTVNQGTVGIVAPASGGPVAIPGDATNGLLVNLGANNDVTVTGSVTANAGTNLNTSSLLTTSAHDAAFGTAGSADTQVRTVQGIASMIPLLVNVSQMNGVTTTMGNGASGTGVQRVTLASDSTGVLASVGSLTQMNGQTIAMGTGTRSAGTQRVTIATDDVVPASQSGTWTVQPGNTANTTPWLMTPTPVTSGGTSTCYLTSAASTNSTSCKASAGQIYGYDLINTTTTIYYLRLYNASSAPTCSSATGFVRSIPIPPAGAAGGAGGIARASAIGQAYGTGIGFCLTGGGASTDNTSAGTGVYIALDYK